MKIVDKRDFSGKQFCGLKIGDTFIYEYEVFMKVAEMQLENSCSKINAILLGLGTGTYFGSRELVTPVTCELTMTE